MSTVELSVSRFAMNLSLLAHGFAQRPKDERAWAPLLGALGSELERLAGEAYRLADEASQGQPEALAAPSDDCGADDPIWGPK